MPRFSIRGIRKSFSKESRQNKLELRLTRQLEKEQKKYERYAAITHEEDRINKLRKEIKSYKEMRRRTKARKVKIGGHVFRI